MAFDKSTTCNPPCKHPLICEGNVCKCSTNDRRCLNLFTSVKHDDRNGSRKSPNTTIFTRKERTENPTNTPSTNGITRKPNTSEEITTYYGTKPATLPSKREYLTPAVSTTSPRLNKNERTAYNKEEHIRKIAAHLLDKFKTLQQPQINRSTNTDDEGNASSQNHKQPAPYILTMNTNIVSSMVSDIKARRR